MKKLLTLSALALISLSALGQLKTPINITVLAEENIPSTNVSKGNSFVINSVTCDMGSKKGYKYLIDIQGKKGKSYTLPLEKVKELPIECCKDSKDNYWYSRSIRYSLPSLSRMEDAYSFRSDAEKKANESMSKLYQEKLIIDDPALTSYINSLLFKINPTKRLDSFKYNYKVYVVKAVEPNSSIWPNGTMVISAGILARLHTEDELVALLCHEMNHFICNHYLENVEKEYKKQKGTLIASFIPIVGGVVASTAIAVQSFKKMFNEMGLAFDQSQEIESDQAGVDLLQILGYDVNGMSTCLNAIANYYIDEGDLQAYHKSGEHPKIFERVASTGIPYERRDPEFEKKMASCVTFMAANMYSKGRYEQAISYADQNVSNGLTLCMDSFIEGLSLLSAYDTPETNKKALSLLLHAKETWTTDKDVLKNIIVAELRLGEKETAKKHLLEFKEIAKDDSESLSWVQTQLQML